MDRVDTFDFFLPTVLALTLSSLVLDLRFTYSLVIAVFLITNLVVLCYWFSLRDEAGPLKNVDKFLHNNRIGGHRGTSLDAPENTMAAFRYTIESGADAIELDLEMTSDGIAVLLHDDTVDRTTDGTGPIQNMTWNVAQGLNAAAKFRSSSYGFEGIPLFEDVIRLCLERNTKIFIDVKATTEQVVPIILSMYKKYPKMYQIAAVCSFFPQVVYQVKRQDPAIVTGHTWRPGIIAFEDIEMTKPRQSNLFSHWIALLKDYVYEVFLFRYLWKFSGANLFLAQERIISPSFVSTWRRRGYHVVAWTVNERHAKLYAMHVLKVPFLTDTLRDIEDELIKLKQDF